MRKVLAAFASSREKVNPFGRDCISGIWRHWLASTWRAIMEPLRLWSVYYSWSDNFVDSEAFRKQKPLFFKDSLQRRTVPSSVYTVRCRGVPPRLYHLMKSNEYMLFVECIVSQVEWCSQYHYKRPLGWKIHFCGAGEVRANVHVCVARIEKAMEELGKPWCKSWPVSPAWLWGAVGPTPTFTTENVCIRPCTYMHARTHACTIINHNRPFSWQRHQAFHYL